jgi:hypothetical protein
MSASSPQRQLRNSGNLGRFQFANETRFLREIPDDRHRRGLILPHDDSFAEPRPVCVV